MRKLKFIDLPNREFLEECFYYDSVSGKLYWKERPLHHFSKESSMKTFNSRNSGKEVGTVNAQGYLSVRFTYKGAAKNYLVHRLIFGLMREDPGEFLVDHKNGDTFDNRLENLRLCTSSQNLGNMHKTKRKGLQGAFYLKDRGYWRSSIKINGVQHHLGNFKTEQEAHKTYMSEKQKRNSRF